MVQTKLGSKGGPSTEGARGVKSSAGGAVTVACPDHLTIADLPVAKSLGSRDASSVVVKSLGSKSRRHLGEQIHFCIKCDNPIAIYGRLSPCDHAFCLDCARSDAVCYICKERIQKIQTLKLFEGVFICAVPECLKSFLRKDEFESHIRQNHNDFSPDTMKEERNESEAVCARKSATLDSTDQATVRSVPSPGSSSQPQLKPPFSGQTPGIASYVLPDNSNPKGFDRVDPLNQFLNENVELQGRRQHVSGLIQNSQQGVQNENSIPEYAMHFHQPPNMAMPVNPNLVQNFPQFSYPHFAQDGVPFYGTPFQPRQDLAPEGEQWPCSGSGFPAYPTTALANFGVNYPQPQGVGATGPHSDSSQLNRGHFLSRGAGGSHDAQPPGWQPEQRDKFGGGQG